jgi:hypothetical protein
MSHVLKNGLKISRLAWKLIIGQNQSGVILSIFHYNLIIKKNTIGYDRIEQLSIYENSNIHIYYTNKIQQIHII